MCVCDVSYYGMVCNIYFHINVIGFCKVINTNFTETWIITGRVTNDTWLVENFDTIILDGNVNAHCIDLFPNEIMSKKLLYKFINVHGIYVNQQCNVIMITFQLQIICSTSL